MAWPLQKTVCGFFSDLNVDKLCCPRVILGMCLEELKAKACVDTPAFPHPWGYSQDPHSIASEVSREGR